VHRASRLLAMGLAQQKYALDIRHPFTRADARAAGITVKELISSRYQKVFYNLYVSADVVITPRIRARAALHLADPTAMRAITQLLSYGAYPSLTMTRLISLSRNAVISYGARA
jgi:hypothetical protein